ncbi:hypothetical protein K439DRAFT_1625512 [Ramaria rubella]|nr:hypothetical protein K439DRAFT_1625512 [Ramaria rubella]
MLVFFYTLLTFVYMPTKRECRALVNPYAQDDEPTFNQSVDIRNVPKLDVKTLCFEVDEDYQDDGEEDFEEAMIKLDFLLDELDNPLSTVPMNKAPAKASRILKQAPPDPKEIYTHVLYLNGNGQEVTAGFFVPVTITKLEDVAMAIFHHINRKGVPDEVKVCYGLETDGDWLRLKNEYARAFNKKGEDANTFIYLPNDIQAAHINCKGSKTGTGTHKKAMVGDVDQDVQFHNMLKDEAVGLTDTIKAAADKLSEVLKRCKQHKEDHCHVDKQGRHYSVGYNQHRLWANKLGNQGVTVYCPPKAEGFKGWESGPPPPEALEPASGPAVAAEVPQPNVNMMNTGPQVLYFPSPFNASQYMQGFPMYMLQFIRQHGNTQFLHPQHQ